VKLWLAALMMVNISQTGENIKKVVEWKATGEASAWVQGFQGSRVRGKIE
jgi:hypothetical protein